MFIASLILAVSAVGSAYFPEEEVLDEQEIVFEDESEAEDEGISLLEDDLEE